MDTSTDAFIEYIESQPGLRSYAIEMYRRIDHNAVKAGAQLKGTNIETLRLAAQQPMLTPDNRSRKLIMADALERDPTGRLAAIPSLRAWAERYSVGQTFINWYVVLINAWIDSQKAAAATLVPMQATDRIMEAAR